MESKAKLAGHPVHPMLIVFPLGLLATSVVFDVIGMITVNAYWSDIAYWMIISGLVGGAAAAVFGLIDWLSIPRGTRASVLGLWHGLGNAVVLVLFLSAAVMRATGAVPTAGVFVLSVVGVILALVTGWLGGELVDRLGVGVDDGAHINAPSSLSGRPANDDVSRPFQQRAV